MKIEFELDDYECALICTISSYMTGFEGDINELTKTLLIVHMSMFLGLDRSEYLDLLKKVRDSHIEALAKIRDTH